MVLETVNDTKCSKCMTEGDFLVHYTNLVEKWSLCHFCNQAYDNRDYLLKEFLKEDFGSFPVEKITKNIILARIARAKRQSPWSKSNGDDKGQDCGSTNIKILSKGPSRKSKKSST